MFICLKKLEKLAQNKARNLSPPHPSPATPSQSKPSLASCGYKHEQILNG